jgi:hypothetical protein
MISDIKIPEVKNVTLAVVRIRNAGEKDDWKVLGIINNGLASESRDVGWRG